MKVLGIMGSPKINGNSSTLLKTVLEGAKASGADIVIFSSPNYMGGIQGKLKCALDRLYAFMKQGLAHSFDEEKKVALIITQNASEDTPTCYEAFNHLRYVLNISFSGNYDNPCKLLLGGGLVTHDSAASNDTLMKKAYDMGVELVNN